MIKLSRPKSSSARSGAKLSAKTGVASLYVVVFATILFGVITVSFTRIILSETSQSSNDDLSRSAYDSALAGVEDAKIAVNDYYDCISTKGVNNTECIAKNVFSTEADCENGFPLAKVLYGITDGEVFVQELGSGHNNSDSTASNQAYTCVVITDVTPDYRGTLTSDTRTRVIPLGVNGSGSGGLSTLGNVATVRFSWFSSLNQGSTTTFKVATDGKFGTVTEATVPPTIQLTVIRVPESIDLSKMYYNSVGAGDDYESNTADIIDSTMIFLPTGEGSDRLQVASSAIISAGNVTNGASTNVHQPFQINCTSSREFACSVDLDVSGILRSGDNAFLVAALPYGDAYTDFAVALLDSSGNNIDFKGVQVSVDSTGRTDQLLRRVEVRLDPADLFFPYPQYALELDGSGGESLLKKFWITANCWTESGTCENNGDI